MREHPDDKLLKSFGINPESFKNMSKVFGVPYDVNSDGIPVDENDVPMNTDEFTYYENPLDVENTDI